MMVKQSQSDRVKKLLAGYILGNLSPEEITELKKIISENNKLLEENEILLSVSQLVPQTSAGVKEPSHLRATTLENATNSNPDRDGNLSWSSIIANLAIGIGTIILAIDNHRLRQNLIVVKNQLVIEENEPWQGISELIKNHFNSLNSSIDPVDIRAEDPQKIIKVLQKKTPLPDNLLRLNRESLYLLGGSFSEINQAKGVRFSYQAKRNIVVSFYQLNRQKINLFPNMNSGYIYITQLDKYNIVLWSNKGTIYAIVANLPLEELKQIANNVEKI